MDACPEREVPTTGWATAAPDHPEAVADLEAYLFPPDLDRSDHDRAGVRTDGFVVVHHGAIVYQRYAGGYDASRKHLAWSATKTYTNALAGIAVRDGLLGLDDSICDHLQGIRQESCAVKVVHLLEFSSGWDWHETYEGSSPRASSVIAMLYGQGAGDMAKFVANHPLRDPPGTSWRYSSGDTNVLSAVVGAALKPKYGDRYPWAALLDPIGASGATWERDGAGTYVGSSYLWATPQDLARFGLLLLDDGCWGGQRLLPEGWIAASTAVNPAIRQKAYDRDPTDVQGRNIWVNRPLPEQGLAGLPWPHVPEGAFAAEGHWGQSITMIPGWDLVVVRTADDRDRSYDPDRALSLAMALVNP